MLYMLIVDDSDIERNGIRYLVEKYRMPLCLYEACDGEQALEIMKTHPVDILFTDIKMPHMDGMQLCTNVRTLYPDTRIIICSAYGEFEYAQKAVSLKASSYLLRPIYIDEFIKVINSIINECEQEKTLVQNVETLYKDLNREIETDEVLLPLMQSANFRSKIPNQKDILIESVQHIISKRYSEDLHISGIANEVSVSEGHLCRKFKRLTGISLIQYLLLYRLEKAKHLLISTDEKVADIAKLTGFHSATYFGMVFKREIGITPNAFKLYGKAND